MKKHRLCLWHGPWGFPEECEFHCTRGHDGNHQVTSNGNGDNLSRTEALETFEFDCSVHPKCFPAHFGDFWEWSCWWAHGSLFSAVATSWTEVSKTGLLSTLKYFPTHKEAKRFGTQRQVERCRKHENDVVLQRFFQKHYFQAQKYMLLPVCPLILLFQDTANGGNSKVLTYLWGYTVNALHRNTNEQLGETKWFWRWTTTKQTVFRSGHCT